MARHAKVRHSPSTAPPLDPLDGQRNAILALHREEWLMGRERLLAGIEASREAETKEQHQLAYELLRNAKLTLDALAALQNGEAKAWSLSTAQVAAPSEIAVQIVRVEQGDGSSDPD